MALGNRVVLLLLPAIISFIFIIPLSQASEIDRSLPPLLKGEKINLPLKEAVELAIKRNLDLIYQKYQVDISLEKVTEEKGIFDPIFKTNLDRGENEVPVAETFYPRGFYSEDFTKGATGISGLIFTGTKYGVDLSLERNNSTSQVQTLSPKYTSKLNFSLLQPLLKDFGIGITKTKIRMAEKGTMAARYDVKDSIVRTIEQLEESYWTIVYASQNLEMQKEGLELAREALRIAERKIAAGEIAPASLIEARAGVAEREGRVIAAEGELRKAEYDLKLLLDAPDTGRIHPADLPGSFTSIPSIQESVNAAYDNRPDIKAMIYRIEQKKIEEKFTKNQRLPRLDVVGTYGYNGLSGLPSEVTVETGIDPITKKPKMAPIGDRVKGTPYDGKRAWDEAFSDYFEDSDRSWSVGLRFEVPLGSREARGRYRETRLQRLSLDQKMLILKEQIATQVKKGILDIETSLKMMEAAKAFRKHTEERLNIEKRKLVAGETSFYSFLERQSDFTEGKVKELKALIDHNIAWSKLRAEEGISLNTYGVEFDMGK